MCIAGVHGHCGLKAQTVDVRLVVAIQCFSRANLGPIPLLKQYIISPKFGQIFPSCLSWSCWKKFDQNRSRNSQIMGIFPC